MHRYESGAKPIPGFKLVRRLGRGGGGQVWMAQAPGGVECALKFINLGDRLGFKEYKAIKLLKNIQHINLITPQAFWLRDPHGRTIDDSSLESSEFQTRGAELVIQMRLADKSLADRLMECRTGVGQDALAGLPTVELLRYMQESASALDFLNRPIHRLAGKDPVSVRHGDIKPGNILLIGEAALVCDFGLAGILSGDIKTTMGAPTFTPAYAAPEVVNYRGPSPTSDQYSLAVSYVELRTGRLPYNTSANPTPEALTAFIALGQVELSILPQAERPVVKRALEPKPEDRYPTCTDFVRALEPLLRAPLDGHSSNPSASGRLSRPPELQDLFSAGKRPVPGYRLERLLGRGGYGEVWQAVGPGRAAVALKVVNLSGAKGQQEWKVLQTLREELDHVHLMKMQMFWLLDKWGDIIPDDDADTPDDKKQPPNYLVILTDLAKCNLKQKLKDYQEAGHAGIPPKELLKYARQTAAALDYLNGEGHSVGDKFGSIIHRDIKPENILLNKGGDVKVCDFGLAKFVEGQMLDVSVNSEGMTPYYGAPEIHQRKLTRWTDQYSLAVTYYHLRTGRLPLDTGLLHIEQMMRLARAELDLAGLADEERQVIGRATRLEPTERYPTCGEMVEELARALRISVPDLEAPVEPAERPSSRPLLVNPDEPSVRPSGLPSSRPSVGPPQYQADMTKSTATVQYVPAPEAVAPPVIEKLRKHGLDETSGPGSVPDSRETPARPPAPPPPQTLIPKRPSSGEIEIDLDAISVPARVAQVENDSAETQIRDVKPARPKSDWEGPKKKTVANDWRGSGAAGDSVAPGSSRAKTTGTLAFVAVAFIGVIAWWATRGPDPKPPVVTPIPELADFDAIIKSVPSNRADYLRDKAKGDELASAIASKAPDELPSRRLAFENWVDQYGRQFPAPSAIDPLARVREVLAAYEPTRAEFVEADQALGSPKVSGDEVRQLREKLTDHRRAVGVRRLEKFDGQVRQFPVRGDIPRMGAEKLKQDGEELETWWLTDAPQVSRNRVRSLNSLMKARGFDDPKSVTELIDANPSPAYFGLLLQQYARLTKSDQVASKLEKLWLHGKHIQGPDREELREAYGPVVREAVRASQKPDPPVWPAVLKACEKAEQVLPDEGWLKVAKAEAKSEAAGEKLTRAERDGLLRQVRGSALASGYQDYVEALLAPDGLRAAADLTKAYPEGGPHDEELKTDFRRRRAVKLLRSAALTRWGTDHNLLAEPPAELNVKAIAEWLDRAASIAPAGDVVPPRVRAVRAIIAWPKEPERARELATTISDADANKELGDDFALFLAVKARSLAAGGPAEKKLSLATSEHLTQFLRDNYVSPQTKDTRRVPARLVVEKVLTPALESGERQAPSADQDYRRRLARLYASKGRLVGDYAYQWGSDPAAAATEAATAFDNAVRFDDESPATASYLVERVLAIRDVASLAPKLEQQTADADRAAGLDPKNYLPDYLRAIIAQQLAFQKPALSDVFKALEDVVKKYELVLAKVADFNHASRKNHERIALVNVGGICNWLARQSDREETETKYASAAVKYFTRVGDVAGITHPGTLMTYARHLEDRGFSRSAKPQDRIDRYKEAEKVFLAAIEIADRPSFHYELGRMYYRWVAFGGENWATLDVAGRELRKAAADLSSPSDIANAQFYLGHVLRLQQKFDASREAFKLACAKAVNEPLYWIGRIEELTDEAELKRDRRDGVVSELQSVAKDLQPRAGLASIQRRADAYSRLFGPRATAIPEVNAALKLPDDFPANIGVLTGETALPTLQTALVWLEHYLLFGETPSDGRRLTPAQLRDLAEALVKLAGRPRNDNFYLEAKVRHRCARVLLSVASGNRANADRDRALEVFAAGTDLIHPATPALQKWRDSLARDLRNLARKEGRPRGDRQIDLKSALALAEEARLHAPDDPALHQLILDLNADLAN